MKFCDKCGSYMEKGTGGFVCPRCGNEVRADLIEVSTARDSDAEPVYVVRGTTHDLVRVGQICPRCGHHEAFRRVSMSSGEHAGVKQERTVEHFRCTKCSHTWIESQ